MIILIALQKNNLCCVYYDENDYAYFNNVCGSDDFETIYFLLWILPCSSLGLTTLILVILIWK
jgi:hypothetical protein